MIIIGVNLEQYLHDRMRNLCEKFLPDGNFKNKGFFIPTNAEIGAIDEAFCKVAARLPVSETFELDGNLSSEECNTLIDTYLPPFIKRKDMMFRNFFMQYLYR